MTKKKKQRHPPLFCFLYGSDLSVSAPPQAVMDEAFASLFGLFELSALRSVVDSSYIKLDISIIVSSEKTIIGFSDANKITIW